MIGQCLYETLLLYPDLLMSRTAEVSKQLQTFVRPNNIANILVVFKNDPEIVRRLYDMALTMLASITLPGLEIISSTLIAELKLGFDRSVL